MTQGRWRTRDRWLGSRASETNMLLGGDARGMGLSSRFKDDLKYTLDIQSSGPEFCSHVSTESLNFGATSVFPRKCIADDVPVFCFPVHNWRAQVAWTVVKKEDLWATHILRQWPRTRDIAYWSGCSPKSRQQATHATPFGCACAVKQRVPLSSVQCEHFQQTR